jgi:gamma-glutamyl:cysteine ligase YbdK (ATP-grasp superfamily)
MEKSVMHYLEELEATDEVETSDEQKAAAEADEQTKALKVSKLAALLDKKEKYEEILREMEKTGQKEIALTDSECRLMMNHGQG